MSTTLITAANLPNLLIPGVRGIMADYLFYSNQWKQLYTILPSIKNAEYDIETVPLNAASQFSDGSDIPLGTMSQIFTTVSDIYNYGVGFTITAVAIEDNLYPDQFPKGIVGIKENLKILSEYQGIALFDNAFSTANPQYVLGDGQSMCSAYHPIQGGVVSNTLSPTQLNETSAQDLIMTIQSFKDSAGLLRKFEAKTYLVGIENQWAAQVLTGSSYSPNDTTNAVNPLTYGEYMSGGFLLNNYMANPGNYFMMTNYKEGLVHYLRKSIEIQMTTDQANRNLSVYGNERYRNRCINFRAVAGVQGF